jgi:NAD(P)-dependent dehydrogenase (short-subunit alcohol dehydrogenase family)/acyl carrier protein
VVGDARPPAVAQSPIWGFATTLFQQEHPELAGGIVDLDPAAPAGEVERLLALLSAPLPDPQLAFRQGRLWSHRMVPAPHLAGGKLPPRLRADATYLIAGGRGGLGLVLARSLIQRGARRLILAGRTALPPRRDWARVDPGSATGRQISAIREMEALGASIHPEALDVSDEGQVREFLEAFRGEGWPPIRGVIHAAGVMSSARLSELGASGLRATLAPKLAGAWNLHRLLAGEPLDFFVLCSSVSSLGFSKGVPDDAAGNAFLDGLAHARRHLGLHGLSVNWSPWGEVGMASQEQVARDFESRGYTPLRPAQGVEALDRCLEHDVRQAAILGVDWPRLLRANFPAPPPPLLQSMVEQVAATAPAEGTRGQEQENLRVRLAKVEDLAARRQLVEDFLRVTLARALKLAPEMLDHERPFQEFGLDSVMAVELRLRIIGDLGVGPNLVELLQESSVAALAERLLPQIQLTTNDESLVLDDLAAQLEALSDEERDALLASLNS